MKKLKKNLSSVWILILELIVGIMLVSAPTDITKIILIVLGAMLALGGLAEVIAYFREDAEDAARNQTLTKGLCMVIGGAALAMKNAPLAAFLVDKIGLVYGALMLAAGLSKLQGVLDILRTKGEKWYIAAINAALTLALAAVVLMKKDLAVKFVGLFLVVQAVVDILVLVLRLKKFEKNVKPQEPKQNPKKDKQAAQ